MKNLVLRMLTGFVIAFSLALCVVAFEVFAW